MIESINNERVKYWAKLNDKKYQDREGKFLVEGSHLVEEAHQKGKLLEVIALNGYTSAYQNTTYVSENVMAKISTLVHAPKIIGIVEKLKSREIMGNVLILDRISDPGNLGTIIRSAVAFNIDTVVLGESCVSLYNPKVIRATEGLIFSMNIVEANIEDLIPKLKLRGYTLYATDVEKGHILGEEKFEGLTAIVIGNEGSGVQVNIKKLCDKYLYIKMNKSCESLNASIATSIILYELNKQ